MREPILFGQLVEIADPGQRVRFLRQVCTGDALLKSRLEGLLDAADRMGSFLEAPVLDHRRCPRATTLTDAPHPTTSYGAPAEAKEDTMLFPEPAMTNHDRVIDTLKPYLEPSDRPESMGRLGHYEILQVIGQGAFGIVLKAHDTRLERPVAIKVLLPALASTSPPRKRFLREARTAGSIRHENVIGIHSVDELPLPFLVMEFVDGIDLQAYLDDCGPLSADLVAPIGLQVLAGLAAAHQANIIHRDLKPSNLLMVRGTPLRIRITDFGLARTVDDASKTQTGLIAGTPLYMSPEQAQGQTLAPSSDLFSVASVLYTLITGRPPFRASTALGVMKRVCEDTPRPILEIIPETPSWMVSIIEKMHAKDPRGRFLTAQEAYAAWADAYARWKSTSPVPPSVPTRTSPPLLSKTRHPAENKKTGSPVFLSNRFRIAIAFCCVALLAIAILVMSKPFITVSTPSQVALSPERQSVNPSPPSPQTQSETGRAGLTSLPESPLSQPTSTPPEPQESFRYLLGATREQLMTWANQQQDRFIIESLNPRHGTNPTQIDAVSVRNVLGSKWELHDVLDDGADYQQNWERFRPAWRMPILADPDQQVRTLFLWVADIPYWRSFVGARDHVLGQHNERSVEQFFPSSLFCCHLVHGERWTLTQAPLPGVQVETLPELLAAQLSEQMKTYRDRGWWPVRMMQHVGFAEPRFAVVFSENPDQLKWDYAEYPNEKLFLQAIQEQTVQGLIPKSIATSVHDLNLKFRVVWKE